jgi:hypothetical protein
MSDCMRSGKRVGVSKQKDRYKRSCTHTIAGAFTTGATRPDTRDWGLFHLIAIGTDYVGVLCFPIPNCVGDAFFYVFWLCDYVCMDFAFFSVGSVRE